MNIEHLEIAGYESVIHCVDADAGLNAFIAVHSTRLGPALGGMRMLPYASEQDALDDVLRLAQAMTFKSAVADTGFGGGKAVIVSDPANKTEPMLRAIGRAIDSLEGRYVTAEDMNISEADLEVVREETRWVSGLPQSKGSSGDPSPYTAAGCLASLRACAKACFSDDSLQGKSVAIQGVGAVGGALARLCANEAMRVFVADAVPGRAESLAGESKNIEAVSNDSIIEHPCDFLSPCARGGVITAESVSQISCKAIAGAANNQLAEPSLADALDDRDILYAPDYVVNAGGVINIGFEFRPEGYDEADALAKVETIEHTLTEVFRIAHQDKVSTVAAAEKLADDRLQRGPARAT
jgi:leucine dehydrogenase